jgi:uncharacterized protein YneF (UPF0154 family)
MWLVKALAIWVGISLIASGFIGRFLAGKYIQRQSDPTPDAAPQKGQTDSEPG